ncbi:MAG: hypothetical protein N3D71_01070 [Burkholderiaceae bacterium]|nr:hypothetical protein [Burkholderiaceae bacterium]
MSLKRRVALALVAVVALFIAAQGMLAYLSLVDQEDDLVDELVLTQARQLAERAERGELRGPSAAALLRPGPDLAAWFVDASGAASPAPLPAHLMSLADGPHRLGRPYQELHVVVLPAAGGRLYVQYDAEQNEAKVREFGGYLIGLAAICLALGAAISWQVADWAVGPIERLTARLANWAPDEGRAAPASDEESRLLGAFARVQDRFEQAIAREREFIANLGHEIRTPLAACAPPWNCSSRPSTRRRSRACSGRSPPSTRSRARSNPRAACCVNGVSRRSRSIWRAASTMRGRACRRCPEPSGSRSPTRSFPEPSSRRTGTRC